MPYSDHHLSHPHDALLERQNAPGQDDGSSHHSQTRLHEVIHTMSQPFLHHDAVITSIRSQYFKTHKKRIWEAPQLHRDTHLPATHLVMGLKSKYNTSRGETWYELFYDLIFVSAAVQIGHMVQTNITFEGMVYAGLLFAVMRATWDELMFYQNRFDTPDMVHYSFYLIQAMCAFTMAGHLTVEGHSGTWDKSRNLEPFVIAAALARMTQSIFYYQVIRLTEAYYNHFFIMAMSQALSALIYLGPIVFPYGWDYYYVYFLVALLVERSFTNVVLRCFSSPKTTYVAPWHMGHMIHREGTFILFILGEAIIQLVQNPGTLDAKDIIRGLMGFAVVFNIGDIYHQQQLVEKHEFKVNHKVAPINLWITGHAVLSMCILFFAAGVKLVYDDEDTARERRRKEEFIMCVFASISLNIIYLLRMQYKGICHGDSLRYGAYGVRIGLSTLIAFIPNMTTDATESVGILFAITFFLVIQELIYRYLRELEFEAKQQRSRAAEPTTTTTHSPPAPSMHSYLPGSAGVGVGVGGFGDESGEPLLGGSVGRLYHEDSKHHLGAGLGQRGADGEVHLSSDSRDISNPMLSTSPTLGSGGRPAVYNAPAVPTATTTTATTSSGQGSVRVADEFGSGIAHALSNHHLDHMRKPAAGALYRQETRQDSGDYEGKHDALKPIML